VFQLLGFMRILYRRNLSQFVPRLLSFTLPTETSNSVSKYASHSAAHSTTVTLRQGSAKAYAKMLHSTPPTEPLTDALLNARSEHSDSTTQQIPSVEPSALKAMLIPPQESVSASALFMQTHMDSITKRVLNKFVLADVPLVSTPTLTLESATELVFLPTMLTTGPIDVSITVLTHLPTITIGSVWTFAIRTVILALITRQTSAFLDVLLFPITTTKTKFVSSTAKPLDSLLIQPPGNVSVDVLMSQLMCQYPQLTSVMVIKRMADV
jgi:hypothetical protein